MDMKAPDLTKRPPRSPRVRLGGYVALPRMLDKGRATIAGLNGEYHYDCPLDQRILAFAGITAEKLKEQLAAGKGDGEILAWVEEVSTTKPTAWDIEAWSSFQERRSPSEPDSRKFFNDYQVACGPNRTDITTWFEILDLDDHVTFGGQA
jgi:hypothetical protein